MDALTSILQKAPPSDLEENLKYLAKQLQNDPDAGAALQRNFPIPFKVFDLNEDGEKPFLASFYNQVGDRHRSPWTNKLYPNAEEQQEEDKLRPLEQTFNEVWDSYKNLYYGHEAVGSVFLKATDSGVFEGLFGIEKKAANGSWSSANLVHVGDPGESECMYHVETHVCMVIDPEIEGEGTEAKISVAVSRKVSRSCKITPSKVPVNVSHIQHIGTLIEANEIDLRSTIEKVLIPKNQETIDVIQKKEKKRPQVNPLMGMVVNSDILKKRLAKSEN